MNTIEVQFLGAASTVTGSKYHLKSDHFNFLIDCGLFQGLKELRLKNWEPLPLNPNILDFVLLTHGHLDHCGYLPKLVKEGFDGFIMGSAPTLAIAKIIMMDSAKIMMEDAKRANEEGFSKHSPALPLYTLDDVERTLDKFKTIEPNTIITLNEKLRARFRMAGHIIGATFIEIYAYGKVLVFSGDIGREQDLLLEAPEKPEWADYLFLESTYGDRIHSKDDYEVRLIECVKFAIQHGSPIIIPSFAVERMQLVMVILWQLYLKNKIPNIPIYIDSPMGNAVVDVFKNFLKWHKIPKNQLRAIEERMHIVTSYAETWEIIDRNQAKIIIAGSGMVTGGRVLTYLQQLIDQEHTQIILCGFQAEGTRGRQLKEGAHELKINGKYYPVKAKVYSLDSLSAHADQAELLNWTSKIKNIPERVFLVHGEPHAADVFRVRMNYIYNWNVNIPKLFDVIKIITD